MKKKLLALLAAAAAAALAALGINAKAVIEEGDPDRLAAAAAAAVAEALPGAAVEAEAVSGTYGDEAVVFVISADGKPAATFSLNRSKIILGKAVYEASPLEGLFSCLVVSENEPRTYSSGAQVAMGNTPSASIAEPYLDGRVTAYRVQGLLSSRHIASPEGCELREVAEGVLFALPRADEESAKLARSAMSEALVRELAGRSAEVSSLRMSDVFAYGDGSVLLLAEAAAKGKDGSPEGISRLALLTRTEEGSWKLEASQAFDGIEPGAGFASLTAEAIFEMPKPVLPPASVPAELPYYIMVNRQANCVTIYGKDSSGEYTVPVKAMVCSTGREGHATPLGDYTVQPFKAPWCCMVDGSYGQYATKIVGSYLFHSICYTAKDKSKMMMDEYNMLGDHASLGCVRLQTADAKWIFDNCAVGTGIRIYDGEDPGPLGKPAKAVEVFTEENYNGWDPTDPDPASPWNE